VSLRKGSQIFVLFRSDHTEAYGRKLLALCGRTPTASGMISNPTDGPNCRPDGAVEKTRSQPSGS